MSCGLAPISPRREGCGTTATHLKPKKVVCEVMITIRLFLSMPVLEWGTLLVAPTCPATTRATFRLLSSPFRIFYRLQHQHIWSSIVRCTILS